MGFTKRELIQFLDGLVELASEENKVKAVLAKEKFLSDFEKTYGYEKEVITEVSKLPPHYIAAMPDSVQEEIRQKVIAALTEHGECTPENVDRAMSSKIYDLEDLIDIREYVERIEDISSVLKYLEDDVLLELSERVHERLKNMSDEEFAGIDFVAAE